eukprot:Skav213591  [mRNA]  locus=scaffold2340:43075:44337:- [translate_table: standard]
MYWYLNEFAQTQKELMQDLGCYCKSVSSMKDCPDYKTGKEQSEPEYARFFHSKASFEAGKPHLCCKFARSAWYDRKGLGYRKATAEHCFSEVRPLPEGRCCRLGKEEQVAVRVKRIRKIAWQKIIGTRQDYDIHHGKSMPYFSVNDIASAMDYDGSALSVQQVKELLQDKEQAGVLGDSPFQEAGETMYSCSKDLDELTTDQEDCRVRTEAPTEP